MKTLFALLLLASSALQAGVAPIDPPIFWNSGPSITFYTNKTAPTVIGQPKTLESVNIAVSGYDINSYAIRGDSLILYAAATSDTGIPGPIPLDGTSGPIFIGASDTSAIFPQSGLYNAFLAEVFILTTYINAGILPRSPYVPLGAFRILPALKTAPAYPVSNLTTQLRLVLGETEQDCGLSYTTRFQIRAGTAYSRDSALFLTYSENPSLRPCRLLGAPILYGPVFDLGLLPAKTFPVYAYLPGDTGATLTGSLTIGDPVSIQGYVRTAENPLILCILPGCNYKAIPKAVIKAIPAPLCDDWEALGRPADTVTVTADSLGRFSLTLPNTTSGFELLVDQPGYFPQRLFTSIFPISPLLIYPPIRSVTFGLVDSSLRPVSSLNVSALYGRTNLDSVLVQLTPGRQMSYCVRPLEVNATASVDTGAGHSGSLWGYTDKNGQLTLSGVGLNPYIDYHYTAVTRLSALAPKSGIIRFNPYAASTLSLEWERVSAETAGGTEERPLSIVPTPCNPSAVIRFSNPGADARVTVFDMAGRVINDYKSVSGTRVDWNGANRASGIYMVRLLSAGKVQQARIYLLK